MGKFDEAASGNPEPVADDPYADLFADCVTADDVLQLQREIEGAEAAGN